MTTDILSNVTLGTHIALLYKTKEDLIDVLVPYFRAGLKNNEFCMWVTSESFSREQAEAEMRSAEPAFNEYMEKGQMKILSYSQWYLKEGVFDRQNVLKRWVDKLSQALSVGYVGMRVTGNTDWVGRKVWRSFFDYEKEINEAVNKYKMTVVCSYCIDKWDLFGLVEVTNKHQFTLFKRDGEWELIKNEERKIWERKVLDYQAQLKSLASQLSLAGEQEKHRIAIELHDQIGQSLIISKLQLDELRASVSSKKVIKRLDEVCNSLGQSIDDMRLLMFDLSFSVLYELGFEAAVAAWLAEQIEKKYGIATEFKEDKEPKPLDDDVQVLLFRSVRELLINVVKHAGAKKVKVSIHRIDSRISVGIEDDGVGFDPEKAMATAVKKGGFGLFGIREHLQQIGGYLEIESELSHGTRVTLVAPLKQEKIENGE